MRCGPLEMRPAHTVYVKERSTAAKRSAKPFSPSGWSAASSGPAAPSNSTEIRTSRGSNASARARTVSSTPRCTLASPGSTLSPGSAAPTPSVQSRRRPEPAGLAAMPARSSSAAAAPPKASASWRPGTSAPGGKPCSRTSASSASRSTRPLGPLARST